MTAPLGIVFDADPRQPWLADRSARSLRHAGLARVVTLRAGDAVPRVTGPVLALRAGAWLRQCGPLAVPPAPASGAALLAVGVPHGGRASEAWGAALAETGGDFSRRADLPPVVCAWVMPGTLAATAHPSAAVADVVAGRASGLLQTHRVVRWSAADVDDDLERLRVVQVVTSLQQGGAERVTWDLHDLLPDHGVDSRLVTLGRPTRRELPPPARRVDLAAGDFTDRTAAAERVALRFGADVIHAHLVRGDDAARLARSGVPLVMTVHNTRAGWPEGLDRLPPGTAALLVACARAVEREVREAGVAAPTRTAWNGIDVGAFASIPRSADPRRLTLACVANPRPQKRLHLLPAVLAAVRAELSRRGDARDARLVVAGELPAGDDPGAASDCVDELFAEARRRGVAGAVEWTNGSREVRDVLAAADVFVSTSAHEGLSLAQLEALAAGVPVVATAVGGTAELARDNPAVTLLPAGATPNAAAEAILRAVSHDAGAPAPASSPSAADAVRRDFSRERMAGRYAWLYRAVHGPARGDVLWFVANNLCTGGAQSSLRRLAKALHAQGQPVRVAVLQEHEDDATPGRLDLLRAGVPVTVLPPAG